jgi:peptide/nickel transport system permease protein
MIRLVGPRLAEAALTLAVASFVVFVVGRLSGNPVDTLLPIVATPEQRQELIRSMGLDRPILEQYLVYLHNAVRGDFGVSLRTGRPVTELVADRLLNSAGLATVAVVLATATSIPLGITAAVFRNRAWDRLAMSFALFGQSVPSFWMGIVAVLIFSVNLTWLPSSGSGSWEHFILPAIVLGWSLSAGITRLLRSSMLEVLDMDYVRVARAKGLRESVVVVRHALRNALVPVVTFVGFMYGAAIGASITIEVVFAWPGLGRLAYEAIIWRDYPLLQFVVLTFSAIVIGINLLVDLSYMALDPRIRM